MAKTIAKISAKTSAKTSVSSVDPSIFKAYDIRGVYPGQLNAEAAYLIAKGFVSFLKCKEVVVGRDARISSPQLHEAVVRGLTEQGADVIDIGLTTTPMFYFSIANYGHEAGMMITASHNPKQYNGLKLCREKAIPLGGETGIMEIRDIVQKSSFPKSLKKGSVSKKDPIEDYAKKVLSFLPASFSANGAKHMKIVVDAGNGMAPMVFPTIIEGLPLKITKLFFDVDCSFPNHEANPSKEETLGQLKRKVMDEKADLGVAFDGDADRIAFIDERGDQVPNDLMTALIAESLLKENKGAKILYEVRSSWAVKDAVLRNGGKPVLWKAGHALIKEKMRKEDILFGGEKSGHYFYKGFWYADSAMITFVTVLSIISRSGKKLSELIRPFRVYHDSGELNFEVEDKEGIMLGVENAFKGQAKSTLKIDGLTMEFDDWWFNLRKSNTEPLIRLNLEAKTRQKMDEMREKLKKMISGKGNE